MQNVCGCELSPRFDAVMLFLIVSSVDHAICAVDVFGKNNVKVEPEGPTMMNHCIHLGHLLMYQAHFCLRGCMRWKVN
jgi:hypothetical protein